MTKKIAYIHGRPSGHPLHDAYAKSLSAEFIPVDFLLRWHDKGSSRYKRYLSWLLCALFLPNRKKYDVILSEGAHFIVGLQKWLHLLKSKQKTVALLDNETLYFIDSGFYSERTKKSLINLIKSYDGIISAGKMEADLAKKYSSPTTIVKQIFNGISDERLDSLLKLNPSLMSFNIVFIGNIGSDWRSWYKGVDLILESFELAWKKNNLLRLQFIGEFDKIYFIHMIEKYAPESKSHIENIGYTNQLDHYLDRASLYLHTARGEAWGISITEAMAAGIMPLVSCYTGSMEVVNRVDDSYVLELNKYQIAEKILKHFNLSARERFIQSKKCKEIASEYSETKAIESFINAFNAITNEFNIKS